MGRGRPSPASKLRDYPRLTRADQPAGPNHGTRALFRSDSRRGFLEKFAGVPALHRWQDLVAEQFKRATLLLGRADDEGKIANDHPYIAQRLKLLDHRLGTTAEKGLRHKVNRKSTRLNSSH